MRETIFKDLKVVELAGVLAGPAVGMFFSELGATVIKIENKKAGGDMTRSWKLPSENNESDISAYFSSVNYKKNYIDKDLKDPVQREEVISIIKDCDILITNFKKGSDIKLGMDYQSLVKVNPQLIYAAIEGFVSNPSKVAFDLVLQAETGFMGMNGYPDEDPAKLPVALIDILAAHQLKEAILIALLKRAKTNKGSFVNVSLEEAALSSLANQASNYLMEKHIPARIGSLHPNIAPYGELFKLSDAVTIVLAIGTDNQFRGLCKILDCETLLLNESFADNANRVINRIALKEELLPFISKFDSKSFIEACNKLNVPVGEVKNMEQVMNDPIAKSMILEEEIEGVLTKRIKTVAFHIKDSDQLI